MINQLVKKAIEEPCRWIAQNAGFDGSIVIEKVKGEKREWKMTVKD